MTLAHDTETDLSTLRFYVNGSLILSNSVTGNSLRPSLANKPLISYEELLKDVPLS